VTAIDPFPFGDYDVLELIETIGGAGTYRARQRALDRLVTLTILPPEEGRKVAHKTRFDRQFLAATRLQHPNVVAAIDAGTRDGHRYIVSEYAGGHRLSDALDEGQWFPLRRCVAIALDIANALVHLESHRIVHRGLSPRAIVLAESGVAKLRGFSLSKEEAQNPNETWFDLDVHAARYTAPEIVQLARHIDGRADIYSLGCVLYHLVAGRPPFDGTDASSVLMKHVNEEIPDPRSRRQDLPDGLSEVLAGCLQRDRDLRVASPRRLVEDLKALQAGREREGQGRNSAAIGPGGTGGTGGTGTAGRLLGWLKPMVRR
jgi:serine/threonine protein kinase